MNVKIEELMTTNVVTVTPHETLAHIKTIFGNNRFSVLPVVGPDKEPVGIVSVSDILSDSSDSAPVSSVMTGEVYTIPQYEEPSIAARMMRNHKIHHLVVTHEKSVVGVLSSYDLLKLVEKHRYVEKNAASSSKKKGKRAKSEASA